MSNKIRQVSAHKLAQWSPLLAALLAPAALAEYDQNSGRHGVLHVAGSMTESACRLHMGSAYQAIDLGNVGTAELQRVGDRTPPMHVQLRLQDCARGASTARDAQGNLAWSASLPSVSLSFSGVQDHFNPELVRVEGVGGVGLRLLDRHQRDVGVGQGAKLLLLDADSGLLDYYISAERTVAPLQAGRYSSLVMFGLSYD